MPPALARGASGRGTGKAHDVGASPCTRQVSSFPSDLTQLSTQAIACRKLIINNVGAGTKVLGWTGPDGVSQTLDATNLQGVALEIEAIALTAATTVTSVLVFF